jgi:hypothetical protein
MSTCVKVEEVCKTPTDIKDWGFDWSGETFRFWRFGTAYDAAARVRPTVATGFEYEASGAGQSSGKKEPRWPITLGGTVVDGSITWTAVALSVAGLVRSISSSTWAAEDADITLSDPASINAAGTQFASVKVNGGTDGNTRDATNEVTFSDGVKLHAILRVTIEDEAD